ncbi:MAG TPA: hypothetical protein VHC69_14375 [Polyangiaceae bacterium]|nr:hypothetical protein [Polyangiaceae bacterium]
MSALSSHVQSARQLVQDACEKIATSWNQDDLGGSATYLMDAFELLYMAMTELEAADSDWKDVHAALEKVREAEPSDVRASDDVVGLESEGAMSTKLNSELLGGFLDEVRLARKRILARWDDTEQNGDLAWTLMDALKELEHVEDRIEVAIEDEQAGEQAEARPQ